MHNHPIEHVVVSGAGLSLGALLAMCITPGDVLLPLLAAITLAVFVHEFFKGGVGAERRWRLAGPHRK